jgi:selenocysteine lyase/cysteine desulfurase
MYGLGLEMSGHRLVYLDAAATTQRLRPAIEAMNELHATENANIHQEGFALARQAKKTYEGAREVVAKYIGARRP